MPYQNLLPSIVRPPTTDKTVPQATPTAQTPVDNSSYSSAKRALSLFGAHIFNRRTIATTKPSDVKNDKRSEPLRRFTIRRPLRPGTERHLSIAIAPPRDADILGFSQSARHIKSTQHGLLGHVPQRPTEHRPETSAQGSVAAPRLPLSRRPSGRRIQTKPSQSAAKSDNVRQASPSAQDAVHHESERDSTPSPSTAPSSVVIRAPPPSSALPYNWDFVLEHYEDQLTTFEKNEIIKYSDIYYFASLSIKRQRVDGRVVSEAEAALLHQRTPGDAVDLYSPPVSLHNDGFDDENGDYLMVQLDHLAYRYEMLYPLGAGSFGQVICCRDHQTNTTVAVKVIRNRKKYKEQAVIEIQVLSQLLSEAGGQHSVIQMLDYFHFRNHLCITFELLGINLYDYLKLRYFQGLPLWNIQSISRQLLQALVHLRGKHIVHCDLKPENVLVRSPLEFFAAGPSRTSVAHVTKPIDSICLIDFGSSCLEYSPIYTYIQSRFYRSPEVILGYAYDTAIDMWSFGCILVELHTGHPLFAGESETEQLMCMMELLGEPSAQFLVGCKRRKQFFMEESAKNPPVATPGSIQVEPPSVPSFRAMPYTNSRGRKRIPGSRDVQKAIKSTDVEFVEFVLQCFTWDPRERLTPERALTMPWMLKQLSRES